MRARFRLRRRRRALAYLAALAALLVIGRLVSAFLSLLQHVFLGSYPYVPGPQVQQVYWASIRFAVDTAGLLLALAGLLVGAVLGWWVRRR